MGEYLMARQRPDEAIVEYELVHLLNSDTETMLGLFDAIDATGRREDAIRKLKKWVADHPKDVEAQRKLAIWYLPMRRLDEARTLHESLLAGQPADPVLLSNLARLYQLDGDNRARELAERAVVVRPDWPVALDTLGWILITEGAIDSGLEYLRQAIARANNHSRAII